MLQPLLFWQGDTADLLPWFMKENLLFTYCVCFTCLVDSHWIHSGKWGVTTFEEVLSTRPDSYYKEILAWDLIDFPSTSVDCFPFFQWLIVFFFAKWPHKMTHLTKCNNPTVQQCVEQSILPSTMCNEVYGPCTMHNAQCHARKCNHTMALQTTPNRLYMKYKQKSMFGVTGDDCLAFPTKLLNSLSICYWMMENHFSEV